MNTKPDRRLPDLSPSSSGPVWNRERWPDTTSRREGAVPVPDLRSDSWAVDRVQVPEAAESRAACLREGTTTTWRSEGSRHGKPNNFAQKGTHTGDGCCVVEVAEAEVEAEAASRACAPVLTENIDCRLLAWQRQLDVTKRDPFLAHNLMQLVATSSLGH